MAQRVSYRSGIVTAAAGVTAVAQVQSLAPELPHATGAGKTKHTKKKKKKVRFYFLKKSWE